MSQYYDREKFSGNTPPRRPPQKKQDDWDWIKWPIVIILFSMGLWPVAIIALAFFSQKKKKDRAAAAEQRSREAQERVERAMKEAEERIARAKEQMAEAENATHRTAAREAMDRRRAQTAQTYTAPAAQQSEKRTDDKTGKTGESSANSRKKVKTKEEKRARLLRILGICALVLGAILCLDGIPTLIQGYSYILEQVFMGTGFLTGGGIMLGRGEYLEKLSRRTQRYILAIGAADTMRIEEIAKRVNRTPEKAEKELQKLIDKGYLGDDAYIDHEKGCFARFGAVIEEKEEPPVVSEESEEGYSKILHDLRTANDRIPDAPLSAKIERLEQISALIFKEVEAHPEKRSRIHTFFDYYLPTTQKLLDTYAEFDEMGVEGENVRQAKERIKEMMDSIVEGFEHQLDQLYSADAMEVVSDIKVMETMLNRDTASAARDFGYARANKPDAKDELKPQQLEM